MATYYFHELRIIIEKECAYTDGSFLFPVNFFEQGCKIGSVASCALDNSSYMFKNFVGGVKNLRDRYDRDDVVSNIAGVIIVF